MPEEASRPTSPDPSVAALRLPSRGYTIRHTETWHRDGVSESFAVWDPPEITEADLPY